MKKIIGSAAAFVTSFSLLAGVVPLSEIADAVNTETGVMDTSDMFLEFGEMEAMSLTMDSLPRILSGEDDDYLLGSHLDANNRAVYDAFRELVNPSLESFTVKLPKAVSFKTADINSDENEEFYNAVFSSCASGMEAASFDTPWIFWLDQNKVKVSSGSMKYSKDWLTGLYTFTVEKLTFVPAAYDGFASFDEITEYKEKLEEAVDSFVIEGDTAKEKLKCIHDKICYFTDYDVEGKFSGSALSALVEPGAVCEGYSKGFKLLCDKIGIPAVCVFGNFNEAKSEAHMWNYVRMDDGYWYAIDVTWDDYDGKYGYELVDNYFLKGSDDFNVKHTPFNDYNLTHLEYPEIATWNYGSAPVDTVTTPTVETTTHEETVKYTTATKKTTTTASVKPAKTTTVKTSKTTKTTTKKPAAETTTTTTETATSAPDEYEYGDLNHDGKVSIADLVYCASFVMGVEPAEFSCDIDGDGKADIFDVIIMRKLIVKKMMMDIMRNK